MWTTLIRGWVKVGRMWSFVSVLWLIQAAFGGLFFAAAGYWLSLALDDSLVTRTLLRDLDPNVLVDLYSHHGESFRLLVVIAALLAVGYIVLWFWLYGTVIFAVRAPRGTVLRAAWRSGLHTTVGMARLFAMAAVMIGLFTGLVAFGTWGVWRWTIASPAAMRTYQILGVGALVWAAGVVFLTAVHDHARIRVCATGEGAWVAYRWAWSFLLRGGEQAFLLAAALQIVALCFWTTYHSVGMAFPVGDGSIAGLIASLLLGELFLFGRMWIRVWFFAAQSELQE